MLRLLASAGPKDVAICLISGGGSALLPAPDGITLDEKQAVTKLLHASGASINEMNAVRKHLSRIKGGRLAQAFRGQSLYSLIISDVVGDPLSVIASGPTSADPTTFAESLTILDRYGLSERVPEVVEHLKKGQAGGIPETLKELPDNIHNVILANNAKAVAAASRQAESLGYRVLNLGSFIEGETRLVAETMASLVRSIRHDRQPLAPPVCILSGGETTVTLGSDSGKGGRNQEFALALAHRLGMEEMRGVVVLSGGTDGEDGPTDAAGACLDEETLKKADPKEIESALVRHDAYTLLDKLGSLIRVPGGLTETNVMDMRVILVSP
jgi:glycerate 2-kinase